MAQRVNISNHPFFKSITRTAENFEWLDKANMKVLAIGLKIRHYSLNDKGVEQEITQLNKLINFLADNTIQIPIDVEGNTMGDYDYFEASIESGASTKDIFAGTVDILDKREEGGINSKMTY